jgi:putative pyruvate formate lyase activating enzyme
MTQENIQSALKNYYKILEGKRKPKFKVNKKLLLEKIKTANEILKNCELCERKCHVNRLKGELGFCKVGDKPIVTTYFTHLGEERMLVPSFTIFFWSCTFSCQYCQNWSISQRLETGHIYKEEDLAEIIDRNKHCKNVNFVGGDPTPHLPFILKTLKYVKADMPVVWNSNFYMSEKSMDLLKDIVDVYLPDWKYWSNKCARRLSKVDRYIEVVRRNHELAFKDSEVIIRHLVLPSHFECCTKPILKFIAENFGEKVVVNIMAQYRPEYRASEHPDINRRLTLVEFQKVIDYAKELKLNFIT